jgi:hypothetical protein
MRLLPSKLIAGAAFVGLGIVLPETLATRAASAPRPGIDWPQFRGIRASGVAEGFTVPTTWNIAEGKGVAWKTAIPGLGHSSPVVWGDQIFITTSISGQKDAGA